MNYIAKEITKTISIYETERKKIEEVKDKMPELYKAYMNKNDKTYITSEKYKLTFTNSAVERFQEINTSKAILYKSLLSIDRKLDCISLLLSAKYGIDTFTKILNDSNIKHSVILNKNDMCIEIGIEDYILTFYDINAFKMTYSNFDIIENFIEKKEFNLFNYYIGDEFKEIRRFARSIELRYTKNMFGNFDSVLNVMREQNTHYQKLTKFYDDKYSIEL